MKCPFCNKENTKVIDSRPAEESNSIRRRRQCDECGRRFTTYEKIENIEMGIIRSCHKRPISMGEINQFVDEIENQIFNMEEKEISSSRIGEIIMDRLKDFDSVAYVRFASVYREFKDVNTFMNELKKLLE